MKCSRLILGMLALLVPSLVSAEPNLVQRSTFVAVNQSTYVAATYLDVVLVAAPTTGGVLELYDSTFTTSVLIASVSLATVNHYPFNNLKLNKGLYYKTSTATNGVTIIYKNR